MARPCVGILDRHSALLTAASTSPVQATKALAGATWRRKDISAHSACEVEGKRVGEGWKNLTRSLGENNQRLNTWGHVLVLLLVSVLTLGSGLSRHSSLLTSCIVHSSSSLTGYCSPIVLRAPLLSDWRVNDSPSLKVYSSIS